MVVLVKDEIVRVLMCGRQQLELYTRKRAFARKPRDAAAVLFGLKFADNIHSLAKSSQASILCIRLPIRCNRNFCSRMHVSPQYKTLQTDRRQTTCCSKGATDSTVGQKCVALEILAF